VAPGSPPLLLIRSLAQFLGSPVEAVVLPGRQEAHKGGLGVSLGRRIGMRSWYVVKTNPRKEDGAAMLLSIASEGRVETYLPKLTGRSTRGPAAGRMQPLFPGYVFARFEAESDDSVLVKRSPGVAYVLGYGGIPIAVPEELVFAISRRRNRLRDIANHLLPDIRYPLSSDIRWEWGAPYPTAASGPPIVKSLNATVRLDPVV